ncbi:MAG: glycosyltransferase [Christensenellales bacterium]
MNKKIKILVDGISSGLGGTGAVINNILTKIDRDLFEPVVLFTYDSVYEPIVAQMGIVSHKITPFGSNPFAYKKQLSKIFAEGKFDYVWVNNTSKVNMIIFDLAKKYGVRTIAHSHGESIEYGALKSAIFRIMECVNQRRFYKQLDIALSCSDNSAKYFYDESKLGGKKVTILGNAIDLDAYRYNDELRTQYREKFGWQERIVIGTAGRLVPIKNQKVLIEAIKKVAPQYLLVIVGEGELHQRFDEIIQAEGLQDRVRLLGMRKDVAAILNSYDAFVLPSLSEGYCVSVVEGYANGLDCFVSDTVKNPSFDEITYLPCQDVEAWARAIGTVQSRKHSDRVDLMKRQGLDLTSMVAKFQDLILDDYKGR